MMLYLVYMCLFCIVYIFREMHNDNFIYLKNNIPFPIYILFVSMSFYLNKYIGLLSIGILMFWIEEQKVGMEGYTVKMNDDDTCCHCQKCSTLKSAFDSDILLLEDDTDDNKKKDDKNVNNKDKDKKPANINIDGYNLNNEVDNIRKYVSNSDKGNPKTF